ncbi:MAG: hypothetical protein MUC68_00340 [Burkholderiaceae bacterium]|jgi:hypothetical protein|nr:hypothetical protein [Burkholderiaceae bacterium]
MATNTLAVTSVVAKECLAILKNMLTFSKGVNRSYEAEYNSNMARGYETGATINIRRPPRFTYRTGRVASPQNTVFSTVPLTLAQGGADMQFSSFERTLSISNPNIQKVLQAGVATIANRIDLDGLALARTAVANQVSVNSTTLVQPATQAEALALATGAGRVLDDNAAPRDGNRQLVLSPGLNAAMVQGLAGLFNQASAIGKQYGVGMMVDSLGFNVGMDQNTARHTNGAAVASNINGAGQTGSTITVVATTGGTLTAGTIITLPGVFDVNPQSRQSTGRLKQFVVTADAALGATSINISPAIVTTGAFQNASASPTTGQPFVIVGNASVGYDTSVAFHRDAFTLAMVPLQTPPAGTGINAATASDDGFTVRVIDYYDGTNDLSNIRLDVLYGWAATYPELACRIGTTG